MPQVPQYDYKTLCAEFLKKLLPIFGPDATILTAASIPELQISPTGTITQISGDPQLVFDKMVDEFSELSPYVVNLLMHELHIEHEERSSGFDSNPA